MALEVLGRATSAVLPLPSLRATRDAHASQPQGSGSGQEPVCHNRSARGRCRPLSGVYIALGRRGRTRPDSPRSSPRVVLARRPSTQPHLASHQHLQRSREPELRDSIDTFPALSDGTSDRSTTSSEGERGRAQARSSRRGECCLRLHSVGDDHSEKEDPGARGSRAQKPVTADRPARYVRNRTLEGGVFLAVGQVPPAAEAIATALANDGY